MNTDTERILFLKSIGLRLQRFGLALHGRAVGVEQAPQPPLQLSQMVVLYGRLLGLEVFVERHEAILDGLAQRVHFVHGSLQAGGARQRLGDRRQRTPERQPLHGRGGFVQVLLLLHLPLGVVVQRALGRLELLLEGGGRSGHLFVIADDARRSRLQYRQQRTSDNVSRRDSVSLAKSLLRIDDFLQCILNNNKKTTKTTKKGKLNFILELNKKLDIKMYQTFVALFILALYLLRHRLQGE